MLTDSLLSFPLGCVFCRFLCITCLLLSLNFPPSKCCLISPSATQLNLDMPHFLLPFEASCGAGPLPWAHAACARQVIYSPFLFLASTGSWDKSPAAPVRRHDGKLQVIGNKGTTRAPTRKGCEKLGRKRPACVVALRYLLLDAILNDCRPIQPQQTFLGQVLHQADDGFLTALGGHAFLLLLIHDHLLNSVTPQKKPLNSQSQHGRPVSTPATDACLMGSSLKGGRITACFAAARMTS